jgi:UDP-N-acetylmuramyl tripeptide synthase
MTSAPMTTGQATAVAGHAGDLRIDDVRALRGPSVVHNSPVVIAEVRAGALAARAPNDLPKFLARLVDALPAVGGPSDLAPGVGAAADVPRSWGEAILRVAMELQRLAGSPASFGRILVNDPEADRWTLAIGYAEEELATEATWEAARILRDCLRGDDPEVGGTVAGLAKRAHGARPSAGVQAIIELARRRGIPVRQDPDDGVVRLGLGVASRIVPAEPAGPPEATLDALYPHGAPTTIPVFAITGTNGKTTTTRLVAHIFRSAGKSVGYTTTDGVYFQEELVLEGDLTGPYAASLVLSNPEVEVAVLETARGGILRAGLGFDECDVGVVLNVTADHLGLRDIDTVEQLAEVKAVIASVVKPSGYTVLNADDAHTRAMRAKTRGRPVFFTTRPLGDLPKLHDHLAAGGIVGCVERGDAGEALVIRDGDARHLLAPVNDIPLTFEGAARFQLENILAASLVAYTQRIPVAQIRAALLGFVPSAAHTPGRMNVHETSRGRVIIDYAHNAAAITGLLDFVGRTPAEHRFALLMMPGDRRDEDMRGVAALAGAMDYVFFKEHENYRRGREPGEIAGIMRQALIDTGFPAERVLAFEHECDAVDQVIAMMQPGDVVAITADDANAVLEQFRPYLPADREARA